MILVLVIFLSARNIDGSLAIDNYTKERSHLKKMYLEGLKSISKVS